ncbi:MAG: AAA family ATPase [Terriglobales bacterium]
MSRPETNLTPELPESAVVLMIGLPGSGKSTWLAEHGCRAVSTDVLRELLFGNAGDQRTPARVFGLLRMILAIRLEAQVPRTFIDATNLSSTERKPLIRLAEKVGVAAVGIWMDTGVEECLRRNRKRQRQVDDAVVRRMAGKLRPPTAAEGVAHLYRVRGGSGGEWVY